MGNTVMAGIARIPGPVRVGLPLAAAALMVAACSSGGSSGGGSSAAAAPAGGSSSSASSSSASSSSASSSGATVTTAAGSSATFLTDSAGKALYLWEADPMNKSTCSGACASAWPPLTTTGTPTGGGSVKAADLGAITIAGGKKQVTYDGHPLYYFSGDSGPKQTSGQGSNGFGAKWYLVAPAGTAITGSDMAASAPAAATSSAPTSSAATSSSNSGGGSSAGGGWS
jgi:predicted lipoprotein with Yx(FWY)xxD motif